MKNRLDNIEEFCRMWNACSIERTSMTVSESALGCAGSIKIFLARNGKEHEVKQLGTKLYLPKKISSSIIFKRLIQLERDVSAYGDVGEKQEKEWHDELRRCADFLGIDISSEMEDLKAEANTKWNMMASGAGGQDPLD